MGLALRKPDYDIRLPNNWQPRPYQRKPWQYLSKGGRNLVLVAHRRYGKDDLALHHTACAAHEKVGSYIHFLPEYEQCRKALWEMVNPHTGMRRIDEAFPRELRQTTREDQMFIRFKCGSTWQLAGSDRYDGLIGSSHVGMVHSEYAISNPSAQSYFAPMLIENGGWQAFIYTPRGKNHGHSMYHYANKQMQAGKDWYAELAPASQTKALDGDLLSEELERLQALHGEDYGKALFLQEYEVSFDAAIPGAIFGEWIEKARKQGRIGIVPVELAAEVHTAWDLGRSDATAIWFFQVIFGEVRVFDYHESNFKDMSFYGDLLRQKQAEYGWRWGTHYIPADAKATTLASNHSNVHEQLIRQNVGRVVREQTAHSHVNGIQAARLMWPKVWLDEHRCARGLDALSNYKYEWDDELKVFTKQPQHDWTSHGATAFRLMALFYKPEKSVKPEKPEIDYEALHRGSVAGMKFGQVRDQHLKKAKARRHEFRI